MIFCKQCGTKCVDTAAFCTHCGNRLDAPGILGAASAPAMQKDPISDSAPAAGIQMGPPPVQPSIIPPVSAIQTPSPAPLAPLAPLAPPAPRKGTKQYKVLSQFDPCFGGRFDPSILEQTLNFYAQQGWRAVSCTTAEFAGAGGWNPAKPYFIAILERDIS